MTKKKLRTWSLPSPETHLRTLSLIIRDLWKATTSRNSCRTSASMPSGRNLPGSRTIRRRSTITTSEWWCSLRAPTQLQIIKRTRGQRFKNVIWRLACRPLSNDRRSMFLTRLRLYQRRKDHPCPQTRCLRKPAMPSRRPLSVCWTSKSVLMISKLTISNRIQTWKYSLLEQIITLGPAISSNSHAVAPCLRKVTKLIRRTCEAAWWNTHSQRASRIS